MATIMLSVCWSPVAAIASPLSSRPFVIDRGPTIAHPQVVTVTNTSALMRDTFPGCFIAETVARIVRALSIAAGYQTVDALRVMLSQ